MKHWNRKQEAGCELCETTFEGPWPEDLWHRDCIKEEFERRAKLDIFLREEQRILIQLGKAPKQSLE